MRWREVPCATSAEYLSHTGFRLFHAGRFETRGGREGETRAGREGNQNKIGPTFHWAVKKGGQGLTLP